MIVRVAADGCTAIRDADRGFLQVYCADCREHLFLDDSDALWLARNRDLELFRCDRCRNLAINEGRELGVIKPSRNNLLIRAETIFRNLTVS